MSNESGIVSKVWSFASVLRDDGVSYGDYLTQLTYLERAQKPQKPNKNKDLVWKSK